VPEADTNPYLDLAPAVQDALDAGIPVVALESTIICHGMPYPQNVETALAVEAAVRREGAVPATIAILGGRLQAGLGTDDIERLGRLGSKVVKTSRRDIPFVVADGADGATTVAGTMIVAAMAGIDVMATGGIGGVHRGVEETLDISADLEELARLDMAVVCSGIKSVLDIGRTLEYLETIGVPVVGYRTDSLPAFYARESGFGVDYRADDAATVARRLLTKRQLGLGGAMLVVNPVPAEAALEPAEIDGVIEQALEAMAVAGIAGKETTPFLLSRIAEETGGRSLAANIALIEDNAGVAAAIAAARAAIDGRNR